VIEVEPRPRLRVSVADGADDARADHVAESVNDEELAAMAVARISGGRR